MNSYKQSLYVSIIRMAANVVMLGALFLGMFQAARQTGSSETVFCLWFFGVTVPAWAGAYWLIRRVRRRFPAQGQCLLDLPGLGRSLVSWQVQDKTQPGALLFR